MTSNHLDQWAPRAARTMTAMATFALAALPACSDATKRQDTDRFAVGVAALSLGNVTDAWYTLRVYNGATPRQLVWQEEHLSSIQFGDGHGSLTYIGPCDASAGAAQNTVELVLEKLVGPTGDIDEDTWQNPAPATDPLSLTATCRENADTPVTFNITVMRDAVQGFFDVAVNFEDVFCSAKLDCEAANGGPIELLHRPGPDGERDTTVVLGFACTSGAGTPTWLHFSDVLVECGTAPNVTSYWLNPAMVPDGNAGGVDPIFYQTAIYRGEEDFDEVDKCYWNMAFGVDEGASAANCKIIASATASDAAFGATQSTPANTIYPYVSFSVPITNAAGTVNCGKHPMNGTLSSVTTQYTGFEGSRFAHSWQCGQTPETERIACSGQIDAIGATFTQSPDGVAVAFGNSSPNPASGLYQLPSGLTLSNDCCMNPCCTDGGPVP